MREVCVRFRPIAFEAPDIQGSIVGSVHTLLHGRVILVRLMSSGQTFRVGVRPTYGER